MCHASTGFFAFVHKVLLPRMISPVFLASRNLSLSKFPKHFLFLEVSCDAPAYNDLFIVFALECSLWAILLGVENKRISKNRNEHMQKIILINK